MCACVYVPIKVYAFVQMHHRIFSLCARHTWVHSSSHSESSFIAPSLAGAPRSNSPHVSGICVCVCYICMYSLHTCMAHIHTYIHTHTHTLSLSLMMWYLQADFCLLCFKQITMQTGQIHVHIHLHYRAELVFACDGYASVCHGLQVCVVHVCMYVYMHVCMIFMQACMS